jgi:ubiquinone/menaquinone biosynthesis C-methylase UbiE
MEHHKLFGFTDVDATGDADYYVRFLDAVASDESFRAYKRQTFELLQLGPGQRVLEVGCGTGDDARDMAARVAPGGSVVAIDSSQAMLDVARRRAEGSGLAVEFRQGDAQRLEFADDSFDACRCDRIIVHLDDPLRALEEMRRVARPGGRVLVYEGDFETMTLDLPDRLLTRRVVNAYCDGLRDGWRARRLPALFRQAGLRQVAVVPAVLRLAYPVAMQLAGPVTVERACAAGLISEAQGKAYLQAAAAAEREGRFFSTLTGFIVLGQK